jgi:hypothetical protein
MWLVGATIACYLLSLTLMGVALGFDHAPSHWLVAAALTALAIGMSASVLMRVAVLVADPGGRAIWWTRASSSARAFRTSTLALRVVVAMILWDVAVRALGR